MRLPSGVWQAFNATNGESQWGRIWPTGDAVSGGMQDWRADLDGGYSILPIVLYDLLNIYGELDGVGAITGYEQASENTITTGLRKWLVVQDVNRTTKTDYFAVGL